MTGQLGRDSRGQFTSTRAPGEAGLPLIVKRGTRWNRKRRDIFFAELSELCNVSAAARAAGFADSRFAYDEKARDPEFARRFELAIAEGYSRLELEMLERARFGENRAPDQGVSGPRQREIPTALAMALLKLHYAKVKGAAAPAARAAAPKRAVRPMRGPGSLRSEVEAMLSQINRRFGGQG